MIGQIRLAVTPLIASIIAHFLEQMKTCYCPRGGKLKQNRLSEAGPGSKEARP